MKTRIFVTIFALASLPWPANAAPLDIASPESVGMSATIDMMTSNRLADSIETSFAGSGLGLNFGVVTEPARIDYPVSKGEYSWGGLATTLFWVDPEEELIAIMLTQYLPWNEPCYRDLMHRMVHAAIIE